MDEHDAPLLPPTATAAYAWQLLQLRRPALALELAEQLLALDSTKISAHLVRTEALRQLGRLPEAALAAKAAIAASPQSAGAVAALAQIRGQEGQLTESEKLIKEALRLDPANASHYAFLAQLQFLQKRLPDAIATASTGLRLNAQHADCLLWRAMAQEEHDQPEPADADLQRALRVAPSSALLHEWRGRQLLGRHEPHAASQHLAQAMRLAPGNTAVLLLLRQAYQQQQWPPWLLRQRQLLRQAWLAGQPFSWRNLVVWPCIPIYAVRSWWRTRHHALFQQRIPGLRRALLRKWLVLAALVLVPAGVLYAFITFDLPPYTLVMLLVAILRGAMGSNKQAA